jgi:predicted 2-oxoglutarate/Fe(II)-dependent dioxygenase YbiX
MNKKLIQNNYIIVPNFITPSRANNLKNEFMEYCEKNEIGGDEKVPNSSSVLDYISFLELLCEKTPEISEILGETVLPTYTYSRIYKTNSKLNMHTDRDSCEISLSLHLGGDNSWPFWVKTPQGENHSVELNPGDAILYLGMQAPHWRNEYQGNYYTQVFFHYVRSRGEYFSSFFDIKRRCLKIDLEEKEIKELSILNKSVESDQDNKIEETNQIEEDNYLKNRIRSNFKLEDFIHVFDDGLPEEVCDLILEEYGKTNEWKNALTAAEKGVDKETRNCKTIYISDKSIIEKNFNRRVHIDNLIFESMGNIINKYAKIFPTFQINIDTGYELLKYEEGEFYVQHTDSYEKQQRSLSCSIQLNDDYDGGEFAFFDREIMIRSKKGSVIVFPSNFMYPHEIMPVIKGTRYSIITWFV